jgi:hypothetical protein
MATQAETQIRWTLNYIKDIYGDGNSPEEVDVDD